MVPRIGLFLTTLIPLEEKELRPITLQDLVSTVKSWRTGCTSTYHLKDTGVKIHYIYIM